MVTGVRRAASRWDIQIGRGHDRRLAMPTVFWYLLLGGSYRYISMVSVVVIYVYFSICLLKISSMCFSSKQSGTNSKVKEKLLCMRAHTHTRTCSFIQILCKTDFVRYE